MITTILFLLISMCFVAHGAGKASTTTSTSAAANDNPNAMVRALQLTIYCGRECRATSGDQVVGIACERQSSFNASNCRSFEFLQCNNGNSLSFDYTCVWSLDGSQVLEYTLTTYARNECTASDPLAKFTDTRGLRCAATREDGQASVCADASSLFGSQSPPSTQFDLLCLEASASDSFSSTAISIIVIVALFIPVAIVAGLLYTCRKRTKLNNSEESKSSGGGGGSGSSSGGGGGGGGHNSTSGASARTSARMSGRVTRSRKGSSASSAALQKIRSRGDSLTSAAGGGGSGGSGGGSGGSGGGGGSNSRRTASFASTNAPPQSSHYVTPPMNLFPRNAAMNNSSNNTYQTLPKLGAAATTNASDNTYSAVSLLNAPSMPAAPPSYDTYGDIPGELERRVPNSSSASNYGEIPGEC